MLLLLASLSSAALAGPWAGTVGVDWVPFGRADLAWIESDQLTDTLVAQTDGMLAPPLLFEAGATTSRDAVLGSLGFARIGTTTVTRDADGNATSYASQHVLGLRLGADYRRYLRPRVMPGSGDAASVAPFLQAGIDGVIPSARRTDDTWTAEEQSAQDDAAGAQRAAIGAVGGRAGGGGELCWDNGLCVGVRGFFTLYRTQVVGEGFKSVSTIVSFEPALSLDLGF